MAKNIESFRKDLGQVRKRGTLSPGRCDAFPLGRMCRSAVRDL